MKNRRTAISMLILATLVVLTACTSSSVSPGLTPTAATSTSQAATSTSQSQGSVVTVTPVTLPALPVEHVPFTWNPSKPILDLSRATESADPYDEAWKKLKAERDANAERQGSGRTFDDSIRDWRVFTATMAGAPREVYSTRRLVSGLDWDATGLVASLSTARAVPSPLLESTVRYEWHGKATIDVATGRATDAFEATPAGRDGAFSGLSLPGVDLRPNGSVFVTSTGAGAAGRLFVPSVQDSTGKTLSLDLPLGASQAWLSNDGKTIVFTGDHFLMPYNQTPQGGPVINAWDVYFLPVGGNEALKVRAGQPIFRYDDDGNLDYGESRIAFVTAVDFGQGPSGYLALYDPATADIRVVGRVPLTNSTALRWQAGDAITISDPNQPERSINLATGAIAQMPPRPNAPPEEVSPNGRRALRVAYPDASQPTSGRDCTDRPYRVELRDVQTGSTRVISECDGGGLSQAEWVNNEKFVLFVSNARAGRGGPGSYLNLLVDVSTGSETQLLPEHTTGGTVVASRVGDRFLLLGERLWLFDSDGTLLRDFGVPPAGYLYRFAAWSPDGTTFAYSLSPAALSYY